MGEQGEVPGEETFVDVGELGVFAWGGGGVGDGREVFGVGEGEGAGC